MRPINPGKRLSEPDTLDGVEDQAVDGRPPNGPLPVPGPKTPIGYRGTPVRRFCVRILNYVTNYIVARLPSFTLRHLWYRRVLGIGLDRNAGVYMGAYVWFFGPGQIRRDGVWIGRNTRINRNCTLDVRSGLTIGDNVSISPEVMILAGSHNVNDKRFVQVPGPIAIEDHVWIGARATILPGVTLGRGSVIAAASVVTRDVPPLTVVAGVPARPVGTRDPGATEYTLDEPLPLFE